MADAAPDFGAALTKLWPMITGVAIASWALVRTFLTGRRSEAQEKAAALKQKGELINIAQDAAKGVIKILNEENERLSNEVESLRREFKALQISTSAALMTKDTEILLLRGELRQALSFAGSYDRLLTEHGIPHEKPVKPFWELVNNEIKLMENGGQK